MENRRIGSPVVELSGNRRAVVDGLRRQLWSTARNR